MYKDGEKMEKIDIVRLQGPKSNLSDRNIHVVIADTSIHKASVLFCPMIYRICCIQYIYSGANKYLIHCRFFKLSHLQRMEKSVIFIVGTPQL